MRRSVSISALFAVLAAGTMTAALTTASGTPTAPAAVPAATATKPVITSVVFTGTAAAPTITVTGAGFGKVAPAHDPSWRPAVHRVCTSKTPTGNYARFGWDYGNQLFLIDEAHSPIWTAGRYRTTPNDIDCIGLIITKYSATQVVYTLGKAYPHYAGSPDHYNLASGDIFEVGVKSARYVAKVKYKKATPVKKAPVKKAPVKKK